MKSCFLIGHRDATALLLPELTDVVERHIMEHGVTEFVVGNYGEFDRIAAGAVMAVKKRHPHITLTMLLAYHPAQRHVEVPSGFDSTFYPPDMERVPHRLRIVRANRYMVEHTDYLIAYVCHPASNAKNLLDYARGKDCAVSVIGIK